MASHISPITIAAAPPLLERRHTLRREAMRDFAGVAVGVGVGALMWLAFLSFTRLPS